MGLGPADWGVRLRLWRPEGHQWIDGDGTGRRIGSMLLITALFGYGKVSTPETDSRDEGAALALRAKHGHYGAGGGGEGLEISIIAANHYEQNVTEKRSHVIFLVVCLIMKCVFSKTTWVNSYIWLN